MTSRADIASAARRIAGHVRHTPLLRLAGSELGLRHPVTLKLELLQHAGSFKPRGAFNRLLSAELPACWRDRRVRRQPRRRGGLRGPRAWRGGGDFRARADAAGQAGAHRQLWRARGAGRGDLCRGAGRLPRPPGGNRGAGGACLRPSGGAGRPGHGGARVRAGCAGADPCPGGDRRRRADRRHCRVVRRQCRGGQRRAGGLPSAARRVACRAAGGGPGGRSRRGQPRRAPGGRADVPDRRALRRRRGAGGRRRDRGGAAPAVGPAAAGRRAWRRDRAGRRCCPALSFRLRARASACWSAAPTPIPRRWPHHE